MATTKPHQNSESLWDKDRNNLQYENNDDEIRPDAAVQKFATAAEEATRQAEAMKAMADNAVKALAASNVQSKETMNSARTSVKEVREVQELVKEEKVGQVKVT